MYTLKIIGKIGKTLRIISKINPFDFPRKIIFSPEFRFQKIQIIFRENLFNIKIKILKNVFTIFFFLATTKLSTFWRHFFVPNFASQALFYFVRRRAPALSARCGAVLKRQSEEEGPAAALAGAALSKDARPLFQLMLLLPHPFGGIGGAWPPLSKVL